MSPRVAVVLGTRPEAIKLAPVVRELRRRGADCLVCSSGQHAHMLRQGLDAFAIDPDLDLGVMVPDQSLAGLTSRLATAVDAMLDAERPDWVVVQGDTTTAFVAALCAYYRAIPVAHVEAGLRTHDRWAPFPEEVNRSAIALVADLHFPPTERAAAVLRAAGVEERSMLVTGNTVVDALLWARERVGDQVPDGLPPGVAKLGDDHRLVLLTSHRRESFGPGLERICRAVRDLVDRFGDIAVVYPVHRNPNVDGPVRRLLGDHPRIHLIEPVEYLPMVWLMDRAHLILTDSGGIQEEAPTLGKPLLVLRHTTERPEVLDAGCARLVGNDREAIVAAASELLESVDAYRALLPRFNPFGDGRAAERIVEALLAWVPPPGRPAPRR